MSDPVDPNAATVCEVRNSRWRRWPQVVALLVLVIYGGWLARSFHPAIATPDANGYWGQGRLLADTGQTWFKPETPLRFVGMHWLVLEDGRYASRYPPGLAVAIAVVCKVFGPDASMLLNPLFALATLVGVFFLLSRLVNSAAGLVGVLALIAMPRFTYHAEACDSHMAVAMLLVWGLYMLLHWRDGGRRWQLYLAGVFLGCIPTIRYPEGLFAIAVCLFLLAHVRRHGKPALQLGVAVVGALTPVLPLLIRNHLLYGGFWKTGYALTNEQTGFGWAYFQDHAVQYLQNLLGHGPGLFLALGVAGIVMMCCQKGLRPLGGFCALIVLPTTLLYMAYYWAPAYKPSATLRFLLPTFPIYVIGGVWMLWRLLQEQSRTAHIALATSLLAVHFGWGLQPTVREGRELAHKRQSLAMITDAVRSHTGETDVILSHSIILQQLDAAGSWRLADAEVAMGGGQTRGMRNDPDDPSPMQHAKATLAAQQYDDLSRDQRDMMIAFDLRTLAEQRRVFYVGQEQELRRFASQDLNWRDFEIIATVALPKAPPSASNDRRGRGMGGPGGPGGDMRERMRQRFGNRGPGGGGLGGMGGFNGIAQIESIIIAEWTAQ